VPAYEEGAMAGIAFSPPPERRDSLSRQDLPNTPVDAAWIIPHAEKVRKNRLALDSARTE